MATSYQAIINGVDRAETHVLLDGFSIREILNGISTLVCKVGSEDASYRPVKRQTIEIIEDTGTSPTRTIFGGTLRIVREHGWGEIADGIDGIILELSADSYQTLASRRFVTESIPSQPLGTTFAFLVNTYLNISPYFVTVAGGVSGSGPTAEAIDFDVVRLDDAFNFLATLSAKYGDPYVWTIGYDSVADFYQTGTVAAPWNLIESEFATLESSTGDIEVEPTDDNYANRIILVGGSGKVVSTSDTFVTDGIVNSFTLKYDLVGPIPGSGFGAVGQAIVIENGITQTLAEAGSGYTYEYDITTNTITRPAGPPPAGTLVVPYDGELKFTVIAEDAAEIAAVGLWEDKILAPELEDIALAQSVADAELARRISTGKVVRFRTRRLPGPVPGESITITVPKRNITGLFTVTDVATENDPGNANTLIRTVTCNSSIHEQEHQTLTRWWSEKDTNGGITTPAGSPGIPAPPLYSLQSNRPLGHFFGEGFLLYYPLFFGASSPERNGLVFPGTAGDFDDLWRAEMGMLDAHGDFSIDIFGPGDRGASPIVEPNNLLVNSAGDIFITSGTSAPNPPVTSPPTEWYWGGIFLTGNDSLTDGYESVGGFFAGGFAPGFQVIPGPQHDSASHMVGFTLFDAIGLKYHPIDTIVANLPFTIDTDGVSDTASYSTFISTAGTGTITLPPVGSTGSPNYFVWPVTGMGRVILIANHSSGTLTVDAGGSTINGSASIALGPFSAVIVHRFSDVATGKWVVLSGSGTITGGGGGGTPLTIGGNDKDVQFNDGGVLGGEDAFEYDKTLNRLTVTSSDSQNGYRMLNSGGDNSVVTIHNLEQGLAGYVEIAMGREYVAGTDTARATDPGYFWWNDTAASPPNDGVGAEVNPGETPDSAMTYAFGRGFKIDHAGSFQVYQYGGLGTGGFTGCGVTIDRNDDGSGAAGFLSLQRRGGTRDYLWSDNSGNLRMGSAPPQEDGTPSDTSGNVIGGAATIITALAADPGAPTDGDVWVRASGTTPTRLLELRIRDGGVSYTIAGITV